MRTAAVALRCSVNVERGEPDLEYGGSRWLVRLARVLDNARILRDSKTDDAAARRVLEVGLRRFGHSATAAERGRAWAMLAEIHSAAGDLERASECRKEVAASGVASAELETPRWVFGCSGQTVM